MTEATLPAGCDGKHHLVYAGWSELPHPRCDRPYWLRCDRCPYRVHSRCRRSSRVACAPCASSYRQNVRRIFASGWTDDPIANGVLFFTVTAPSTPHHLPSGPLCPCSDDDFDCATFNADAGRRFNRLIQDLRRHYDAGLQYCRAAECQERGVLHFHFLIRTTSAAAAALLADFTDRDPYCPLRRLVEKHGFGHALDLVPATTKGAANYCSKYVSKTADDRNQLPWLDHRTGELCFAARYRPWSSSRRWGVTMTGLRRAQKVFALAQAQERSPEPETAPLDSNTPCYTPPPLASSVPPLPAGPSPLV